MPGQTGQALYRKAKTRIPGGTQLLSKRPEMFLPENWPAYYSRATGSQVWDLDGNAYYDMSYNGIAACILGAADPDVEEAVIAAGPDEVWVLRRYERMIAEELNVKHLDCTEDRDRMVEYAVAPNLRSLGPKLKESASEVSRLLEKVDGDELARHLRTKGRVRLGGFDLSEGDVVVTERSPSGYSHANVGDIHVYVRREVSQRLRLEGLSREVIRRIQHMRKAQGLSFEDPVRVEYSGHHEIESAVIAYKDHIMHETHSDALEKALPSEGSQHWSIGGTPLDLRVTRL